MEHDILIVGGGTAGCVLAARLSENPGCRVLLLEAGRDLPPGSEPADIRDPFPTATLNPDYFWSGMTAVSRQGGQPLAYPQARVMGGGSSINGLFALRGVPSDYARWEQAGAGPFSWQSVLPLFRKIENDRGRALAEGGPHPILRTPRSRWPSFVRQMEHAALRAGLAFVDDANEQPEDGFFPMPNAIGGEARVTAPGSYLTQSVRARPNLTILPETLVRRLVVSDGGRVSGVEIAGGTTLRANRVVLSAGAIHSPALLLKSGIGPAGELAALGIEPKIDLPGVGCNLQNHPYMFFALTLPRAKRVPRDLRRFAVAGVRSSSRLAGEPPCDLFNFMVARVSSDSYGPSFALVGSALYAPRSRGTVRLDPSDPLGHPDIDFRLLSHPADPPRMVQAARLAELLLRDPSVAAEYHEAFLLPGALAMKQFNRAGWQGKALALAAKAAAEAPGPLRRSIFGRAFRSGPPVARRGAGRPVSDDQILSAISPMGHPVGTCAMGPAGGALSVVDEGFRVYGTDNLHVVDASVMPVIPSANTNLPTLMLAELAAQRLAAAG